jgi:DNA-binding transcriptional ArsR family regulator
MTGGGCAAAGTNRDGAVPKMKTTTSRLHGDLSARDCVRQFRLLTADEILNRPPQEWLVEGLLPLGGFVVVYGQPGDGKSLLALDLALATAGGMSSCLGTVTHPGSVVYIAADGSGGLRERMMAWCSGRHAAVPMDAVRFVEDVPNLLAAGDVHGLVAALGSLPDSPRLVVIDTLARCMPGADENAAKDMGKAVEALDQLRAAFGCTVVVVHHVGKRGDLERGSTALRGAADTMLLVTKSGRTVTLQCTKQRNARDDVRTTAKLALVELLDGTNAPVLVPGGASAPMLSPNALQALRVLARIREATFTDWHRASGIAKSTFNRNRDELRDAGLVLVPNGRGTKYALSDAGRRFGANGCGTEFPAENTALFA